MQQKQYLQVQQFLELQHQHGLQLQQRVLQELQLLLHKEQKQPGHHGVHQQQLQLQGVV